MIGSRLRKIFRDVWARKSRAAMASAAIFVGVLGVVTLLAAGDLLTSQLRQDIRQEDLPMQAIFVSAPGGSDLDNEAYLSALAEVPGLTHVEGRAVQPLSWKLADEEEFEDANTFRRERYFGKFSRSFTLPDNVEVRVHDSTADLRYFVLPRRPEGTESWTEEQLARIVTRDSMIGTALPDPSLMAKAD